MVAGGGASLVVVMIGVSIDANEKHRIGSRGGRLGGSKFSSFLRPILAAMVSKHLESAANVTRSASLGKVLDKVKLKRLQGFILGLA